jgi:hypothetical protein
VAERYTSGLQLLDPNGDLYAVHPVEAVEPLQELIGGDALDHRVG